MAKSRKKKWVVVGAVTVCAVIGIMGTLFATCPKRAVKKALCAESPVMCRCYSNIVDYRMSDREIAITNRYQAEMKEYGMIVSPLEFATMEEVQRLSSLLGICQQEQMQRIVSQPVKSGQQAPVQQSTQSN